MPTVIDSLYVELGLDTRKFTEGERDALASFKKTKEGAADLGKSVEAEGAKISDIFRIAKGGALGIAAALVGGEGVSFINKIIQMDAATGRLANTIGLSVKGLSTWQGIVRQVGGDAASATSTLAALSDTFAQVQAGQGFFSGPFATLLNRSGVQRGTGPDQALRQIIDYLGKEQASGRMSAQQARFFAESIPGVAGNQDMLNVILAGTDALNKWTQAALAAGTANEQSADTAKDFQHQLSIIELNLEDVGRGLLRSVNEGPTHGKPFWEWFFGNPFKDGGISPGSIVDKIRNWFTGGDKSLKDLYSDLTGDTAAASAPQPGVGSAAGASRGDRNNNPGNIEYGTFAVQQGATGSDGRFAIFPSLATGNAAMATLLHNKYAGLTLSQIQRKWVGNSDQNYLSSMMSATGLGANGVPDLNDNAMVAKLITGMMRGEGNSRVRLLRRSPRRRSGRP